MNVLVTGHDGYIGSALVPLLRSAGHRVVGLDAHFFDDCHFGEPPGAPRTIRPRDVRDLRGDELAGFDAVIHLAALSNDPLGDLDPELTFDINHWASLRLAALARDAGVPRFLFASSCSLYGVSDGEGVVDEAAPFHPVTPYAESKVLVERELREMATDSFAPTALRCATAYGVSPRLRLDLVVNDLVASAVTTGAVAIRSDGSPWRPLVHVEDIARAYLAVLHAPPGRVHARAFNVGRSGENYRIGDVAELVASRVPGATTRHGPGGGTPDPRSYRVDCRALEGALPEFRPRWTLPEGVRQLRDAFRSHGLERDDVEGDRFVRIRWIRSLRAQGRLDRELRWKHRATEAGGARPVPASVPGTSAVQRAGRREAS